MDQHVLVRAGPRGRAPGRPAWRRRRSRPCPSARRARGRSRPPCPGLPRHIAVTSLRTSVCRAAATASCPRHSPPSFGRHAAMAVDPEPVAAPAARPTSRRQQGVQEHAAAEDHRVEPGLARQPAADLRRSISTSVEWNRRRDRARGRAALRPRRRPRAISGRVSMIECLAVAGISQLERIHSVGRDVRRPAIPAPSRPAPRS